MLLRNGKRTDYVREDDFGDKLMFILIIYTFLIALHFCVATFMLYILHLVLWTSEFHDQ